jgi:rhodanese-related sulfurtransferase
MKKLLGVLLVSVITLTACGGSGGKVSDLTVSQFATKIADKGIVLIDVRRPEEFAAGHIAGATNLNFESGTFETDLQKLDKSKSYALYCRSGNRSGQATAIMVKDGFTHVFNLLGGVIDWQGAGQALVTK